MEKKVEKNIEKKEITKKPSFVKVLKPGGANIRIEPDVSSKVVDFAACGTSYEILSEYKDWVMVKPGYLLKRMTEITR